MAGIGFDSKIVKSVTNQLKKYLGKIIFILKGLQYFLFLKNKKMKIEIDNEEVLADWILCTNSKYYAGSYNITKETDIFDSKLIAFIFEDLTRLKLLQYIFLLSVHLYYDVYFRKLISSCHYFLESIDSVSFFLDASYKITLYFQ